MRFEAGPVPVETTLKARALVFFEGETEEQALPDFAEKYWDKHPNDLGFSFVGVGGSGSYLPFLRMAQSYCGGEVKVAPGVREDIDSEVVNAFVNVPDTVGTQIGGLQFNRALEAIQGALDVANKYIVITEPFKTQVREVELPAPAANQILVATEVSANATEPGVPIGLSRKEPNP